jgi:hypothetical protein
MRPTGAAATMAPCQKARTRSSAGATKPLAGLIARHGTLNPFVWRELYDAVGGDPFAELVLHIVAQQIGTGAR